MNATSTKEVFPLFKEHKVWYGPSISSGDRWFGVPEHYPLRASGTKIENGAKFIKVKGVRWFTNFDHKKRHARQVLYEPYNPVTYPTYDNYNAIEISKVKNIPKDYDGVMGVPISFMDKHNPEQFEILGISNRDRDHPLKIKIYRESDHPRFNDFNAHPVVLKNGVLHNLYTRVFIRRR